MPLVNVLINNRTYSIACDDGEEEHLRGLAQLLDTRIRALTANVGQVGDARLLLMAGLLLADELSEAGAKLAAHEKEIAELRARAPDNGKASQANTEERAADALEAAAARIEAIAARLGSA
jgi:cell division protein ZapA